MLGDQTMSKRLLIILVAALLCTAAAKAQTGPSFTSVTLPAGGVAVPYGADLQVTGGTPPYSFAVTSGSLPAGFTLVPTANGTVAAGHIFSDNPAANGTFTFGITVTDSAQLTATATISLTINTVPNTQASLLNGQYALLERSFGDSSGLISIGAGSLKFDGVSSVTGVVDINDASNGVTLLDSITGTYSIGPDNRGFVSLTAQTCQSPPCNVSFAIAVGNVYRGLASTAEVTQFIDDDGNDHIGAGELHLQDTTSFTQNIFAGTYAVEFTGQTPALGRSVYAGLMTFDNAGNIPSVTFDVNDGGTSTGPSTTAPAGTYTGPDANGRIFLSLPNASFNDAIYQISANEFAYVSLNPASGENDVAAGFGLRQANPGTFGGTSITGPDVLAFEGLSGSGSGVDMAVGLATVTSGTLSVTFDENDAGTLTSNGTVSGALTVAANGRASAPLGGQTATIYLAAPDHGFAIGTGNGAVAGQLFPQVGNPFSTTTPLAGSLFFGQFDTTSASMSDFSGIAVLESNTLSVFDDESHTGGDLLFDQNLGVLNFTVAANGHFTIQQSANNGAITGYAVSPFETLFFDTTGPTSDPAPSVHPNLVLAQTLNAPPGTPSPAAPPTVTFPNPVSIGSNAQSSPITITNSGLGPLGFTGVNTANSPDFSASGTCIPTVAVVVVQPQGTCTIIITFAPTQTGTLNETLIVQTDGTSNVTITATGTATSSATVTLAPASLTFGAQVVNTTSAEQQVTVTNVGASPLNFTGFTATGDFACFAQGQSCALPNQQTANPPCSTATALAPSTSCDISVAFTPTATGTRNGTLSIADNATGSPQTVALTGTGLSGQFTVAPSSLNFGTVVINTTSPAQVVTVTNGTVQNQFILSIVPPANFAETDNCVNGGAPLAPGASCTINVTFTPTSATAFSGNLVITAGPQNSPPPTQFNVALTGNGTISTFTLTLAPGSSSTVTVVPGGTAAYGILVTGTPGINQTINFTASTTSNTITVTVSPKSVTITGNGNTQFALVLETFCRAAGIGPHPQVPGGGGGLKLLLLAMALAAMAWVYRRRPRWALSFALLMLVAIGGAACGGDPGANGPTPPGTYPVTLTATSGQQVQTLNLTLIVQ
jgi:hypothetical protein